MKKSDRKAYLGGMSITAQGLTESFKIYGTINMQISKPSLKCSKTQGMML